MMAASIQIKKKRFNGNLQQNITIKASILLFICNNLLLLHY